MIVLTANASRLAKLKPLLFSGLVLCTSLLMLGIAENTQAYSLPRVEQGELDKEADFKSGLQAYLAKDYHRAQQLWVKAASKNHARAMFNLGLLHEQSKVEAASVAKANNWFRLSGRNGYAPAYYHLATGLEGQGLNRDSAQRKEINDLLMAAAELGFKPAIKKLGLDKSSHVQAETRDTAAPSRALNLEQKTAYRRADWIKAQSGSAWTIQLLAFHDLNKVYEFIDQHDLRGRAAYFQDKSDSQHFYKLVLGAYASKSEATQALSKLPQELRQHGPWLRSLGSIQAVL